jgi:uncharacterized protein with HEPN domain
VKQPPVSGPRAKKNSPSIPWLQIVGMRNRLVHGYDAVDLDVLWDTIVDDLPPLITALEKILHSKKNEN